jgi:hypothetical protein
MRSSLLFTISSYFLLIIAKSSAVYAQVEKEKLDPVFIAKNYYNGIVKILIYDSIAAKKNPEKAYLGRGSGFIVSENGYIFTNNHVISFCSGYCRYNTYNKEERKEEENIDAYSLSLFSDPNVTKVSYIGSASAIVQVYSNTSGSFNLYRAKIVAIDTLNFDGAILKITSDIKGNPVNEKFHPLPLGNSDLTEQGEDLCLYGFPAQYDGNFDMMLKDMSTLVFGKHSGFDFTYNTQYGFIKTDAAINSGNSGGPVFGASNKVVGMATASFNKTDVGLISGINAMYDLVALIPELQKDLTTKGLVSPLHKPKVITTILYNSSRLPSSDAIKKINNAKNANKALNYLSLDFGFSYMVPHDDSYIVPSETNDFINTNGGGTHKIPTSGYGGFFRVSSQNLLKNQNKNLLMFFFRVDFIQRKTNWSGVQLYKDYYNTPVEMFSNTGYFSYFTSLGFRYAYILNNGATLSIGYGPGLGLAFPDKIGKVTYSEDTEDVESGIRLMIPHVTSLSVKYNFFFAELNYFFDKGKISYTFPYVAPYQGYSYLWYGDFIQGKSINNYLTLSLGFTLKAKQKRRY